MILDEMTWIIWKRERERLASLPVKLQLDPESYGRNVCRTLQPKNDLLVRLQSIIVSHWIGCLAHSQMWPMTHPSESKMHIHQIHVSRNRRPPLASRSFPVALIRSNKQSSWTRIRRWWLAQRSISSVECFWMFDIFLFDGKWKN